ncbi:hypothetical protein RJT34_31765 [Clitoria ternatea]|uniref:Uncharacterized protein n=1 Tax=Clitoria ternatea TaxID=43366 RepID=A0AAN9I8Q6_CLITE
MCAQMTLSRYDKELPKLAFGGNRCQDVKWEDLNNIENDDYWFDKPPTLSIGCTCCLRHKRNAPPSPKPTRPFVGKLLPPKNKGSLA